MTPCAPHSLTNNTYLSHTHNPPHSPSSARPCRLIRTPTHHPCTAAALSITNFYRSSRAASARAYDSGYAAACHDILRMIERGVSADGGPAAMASNRASASENPMNVGRVMDWIEARLEALKAREEEEAEDEARKDAKDEGRRVRSDVGLVAYPDRDADHPLCPSSRSRRQMHHRRHRPRRRLRVLLPSSLHLRNPSRTRASSPTRNPR